MRRFAIRPDPHSCQRRPFRPASAPTGRTVDIPATAAASKQSYVVSSYRRVVVPCAERPWTRLQRDSEQRQNSEQAMATRECYHCKQLIEAGEPHDCWTTTEAALTQDLSEDLREAWERLRETAAELGEQRIYASHSSIMFSRKSCYFFVRPKKSFLEVCVFLGRAVKSPQIRRVDRTSKTKLAHIIQVRHRDEVEAPLTDWLQEAYQILGESPRVPRRQDRRSPPRGLQGASSGKSGKSCARLQRRRRGPRGAPRSGREAGLRRLNCATAGRHCNRRSSGPPVSCDARRRGTRDAGSARPRGRRSGNATIDIACRTPSRSPRPAPV